MNTLSLARIMYGTSDEHHGSTSVPVNALATHSLTDSAEKPAGDTETLGKLLHKAWTNISGKH
ncbi:MAG TPA: hypothetical protein VJX72_10160 [Candidatus Acidoferrum sp.]|jgi:hypothetical protein|nr:hypothetical protein [Candidatus Acidoferrum sp.]